MQRTQVNRQQILKYEMRVSQDNTNSLTRSHTFREDKYSTWELNGKIQQIMEKQPYNIKWVGSRGLSYLEAYIYVLFSGPLHLEDNFLELKMNIYSLGRQCLNRDQEKMLVQFMCLVGFSQHKLTLLKRYPEIEILLLKMLQFYEKKHKRQIYSSYSDSSTEMTEPNCLSANLCRDYKCIRQVYQALNKQFSFIGLEKFTDFSYTLVAFRQERFHIIQEKNIYFIVEPILPPLTIAKNNFSFIENELSILDDSAKEKLTEQKLTEQKLTEQKLTEQKLTEQKQNFDKGEFEAIFNCQNHQIVRLSKNQPLMEDLTSLFNEREVSEKQNASAVEVTEVKAKVTQKGKSVQGNSKHVKMMEMQELRDNLKEIKHKVESKIKEKSKLAPTSTLIGQEYPYLSANFARINAKINSIENDAAETGFQTVQRNLSPQLNVQRANFSPEKCKKKTVSKDNNSPTTPNFERFRSPESRFYRIEENNRWIIPTSNGKVDEALPSLSTKVIEPINGEKKGMTFSKKEQRTPTMSQKSVQGLKMASLDPKRIEDEVVYRQNWRGIKQLRQKRESGNI